MFEEHINKRVKVVFEDEGKTNIRKGIFKGIDGTEDIKFVKVELDDGKIHSIKLEKINRIDEEDEPYDRKDKNPYTNYQP